ncbi:MAG TPA: hypothetical protein DEO33_05300 [Rikenellaceae bacterium]|nr:hypothetical protein [Rikenellaceae bacterium]
MKIQDESQASQKTDTLIKFLKDTKDGKFIEIKKEILHPQYARTKILRQPQPDKIYYFSIS